ncbi:MAG TPA: DUF4259 domain-containing protein [Terriglobales bacterium]|jgi:hypothetical protein|nr:DUF4259 domain-containing protein [Terriglobales bacterium]
MPGWGTGSFENEEAQNFLAKLNSLGIEDLSPILARASDHDYLDAPEGTVAIVVAEIVATARGNPPHAVPIQISDWIAKIEGSPSSEMSELARRAVEKVRTSSELKDLWLEAEGLNEWSAVLRDLEERLT